jgi:hypothetical protein
MEAALGTVQEQAKAIGGRRDSPQLRRKLRECGAMLWGWLEQVEGALPVLETEAALAAGAGRADDGTVDASDRRRIADLVPYPVRRLRERVTSLRGELEGEQLAAAMALPEPEQRGDGSSSSTGAAGSGRGGRTSPPPQAGGGFSRTRFLSATSVMLGDDCAAAAALSSEGGFSRPRFVSRTSVELGPEGAGQGVGGGAAAARSGGGKQNQQQPQPQPQLQLLQQQMQCLAVEDEVDVAAHIAEERAVAIEAVAEQVVVMRELFGEVAALVNEQQGSVDMIEANTSATAARTGNAVRDLRRARTQQRGAF